MGHRSQAPSGLRAGPVGRDGMLLAGLAVPDDAFRSRGLRLDEDLFTSTRE